MKYSHFREGVSQKIWTSLLDAIDLSKQFPDLGDNPWSDPLHYLCSEKHPWIDSRDLLKRRLYRYENLYGGRGSPLPRSYVFQVIWRRQGYIVEAFLHHGVGVEGQIHQIFDCNRWREGAVEEVPRRKERGKEWGLYSWLTFAVDNGSGSCVDVMIKHGADITLQDGTGRNALQLAHSNLRQDHPRLSKWCFPICPLCPTGFWLKHRKLSLEEDLKMFNLLSHWATRRSLDPSMLFEDGKTSDQMTPPRLKELDGEFTFPKQGPKALLTSPAPLPPRVSPLAIASSAVAQYIATVRNHRYWHEYRRFKRMSFLGSLLIRVGYVFFYSLLLVYGISNMIIRLPNKSKPPTGLVVAGLVLVISWCAYREQMNPVSGG